MNNKKLALAMALLSVSASAQDWKNPSTSLQTYGGIQESTNRRAELTPGQELIFAVKGCKSGLALMAGLVTFNPVVVLGIAATPTPESNQDLLEIQRILDKGADINYRDHYSWTALMYAAYEGYPGIAEFLLRKKAGKALKVTDGSWSGYDAVRIAQHYLDQYQGFLTRCSPDMVPSYQDKVNRYGQIVQLLNA